MAIIEKKGYTIKFESLQELVAYEKLMESKPVIQPTQEQKSVVDHISEQLTKKRDVLAAPKRKKTGGRKSKTQRQWKIFANKIGDMIEADHNYSVTGAYKELMGRLPSGPEQQKVRDILVDLGRRNVLSLAKTRVFRNKAPSGAEVSPTPIYVETKEDPIIDKMEDVSDTLIFEDQEDRPRLPDFNSLKVTENMDAPVMFLNMLKKIVDNPTIKGLTYEMEGTLLGFNMRKHWRSLLEEFEKKKNSIAVYFDIPDNFRVHGEMICYQV